MTEQERAFERQNDRWEKEKVGDENLRVADRQIIGSTGYLEWANAGGPNECAHGYAEGIPCPKCDAAKIADMNAILAISRFTDLREANQEIDRLIAELASEKSLNAKQAETIGNLERAMKINDQLLSGKISNNLEGSRPWPQMENQ